MIAWQHGPEGTARAEAVERLLGPRLRGEAGPDDPLRELRAGMERLAVRDADRRLAERITGLAFLALSNPV